MTTKTGLLVPQIYFKFLNYFLKYILTFQYELTLKILGLVGKIYEYKINKKK